ncbi:MAG: thiamine pyrophosphate-dependent enzyme [Planctomycetota bacterium]|jgi:TPP-dependent pyruvate/acetoin dehydrogenase alpha subunit
MPNKAVNPTSSTTAPVRAAAAVRPHDKGRPPKAIDLGEIEDLRVLDENGRVDEALEPKLADNDLLRIYRAMVLTRKLDVRMLAMQRQGEMGTFAPGFGQEATQIGQIYPLEKRDWFSPSYRSFGAQLWRGWTIEGLLLLWHGFFEGFEVPGVGMAIKTRGDDAVMLTNFGDGALSQGPVNEALNFAAVYRSPVIFVCENNGYAISIPVEKQTAIPQLARRGAGFGIPSVRVDGNDVLAMIVATNRAVQRARSGDGPTFIEAVTYRMSLHTTADDPKVYRDDDEVERWRPKCPIARFEKYLIGKDVLDEAAIERIGTDCEQEILDARERFRARAKARPREVFNFMYEKLPPELERQKREYFDKLDRKGID